jgi:aspartate kinase
MTGEPAQTSLPEEIGFEVSSDYLDARVLEGSYEKLAQLDRDVLQIIPGYYGLTVDKEVAVFSRGGSDLTGGLLAYALDASLYENWTDVSGVYEADPRIVEDARAIPRLTFKEIRLLSSKGMGVLHYDAMLQCRRRKIPIQIRNTNAPNERGTLILNERVPEEGVVGIAKLDGVAYLYLEKDGLSEEMGFTAALLRILNEHGISTYHYPTDKDDLAVLVNQEELKGSINDLRRDIERVLEPDVMDVVYNLTILTPVGLGLKGNSYPIVAALQALASEHINIEMIDQSPSQLCFHVGVSQAVANDALEVLYRALIAV